MKSNREFLTNTSKYRVLLSSINGLSGGNLGLRFGRGAGGLRPMIFRQETSWIGRCTGAFQELAGNCDVCYTLVWKEGHRTWIARRHYIRYENCMWDGLKYSFLKISAYFSDIYLFEETKQHPKSTALFCRVQDSAHAQPLALHTNQT